MEQPENNIPPPPPPASSGTAGGGRISRELLLRIISAGALAPVALLALWYGGLAFSVLIATAAGLMAWEWTQLTGYKGHRDVFAFFTVFAVAAVMLMHAGQPLYAAAAVVAGIFMLNALMEVKGLPPRWALGGLVYISLPCMALLWLRGVPETGMLLAFWLFCVVWATDIFAYVAGRTIGGPKLAPKISPSKTWAGLGGGMLAAFLTGAAFSYAFAGMPWWLLGVVSAVLAVIAQIGDFFESWVKRRVGAKDSGVLIPGHGGILDRVDGLLTAAPAAALFIYFVWQPWMQSGM